jgi:hypothetical protein
MKTNYVNDSFSCSSFLKKLNVIKKIIFIFILLSMGHIAQAQNLVKFSEIKSGMKDEYLEDQGLKIANNRAVNLRCPEEYTKAVILSYKWEKDYDKWGDLAGRQIHMQLYCVKRDGCGMAEYTFRQKYEGRGNFEDKLRFVKVSYMYNVACE